MKIKVPLVPSAGVAWEAIKALLKGFIIQEKVV